MNRLPIEVGLVQPESLSFSMMKCLVPQAFHDVPV